MRLAWLGVLVALFLLFALPAASRPLVQDGDFGCYNSCVLSYCIPSSGCTMGTSSCKLWEAYRIDEFVRWTVTDADFDGDGYYASCGMDCDDGDANVNPGKVESTSSANCNDGLDNDCDGLRDLQEPACVPPFTVTLGSAVQGMNVVLTAQTSLGASCQYCQAASCSYGSGTAMSSTDGMEHTATIGLLSGTYSFSVACRSPP